MQLIVNTDKNVVLADKLERLSRSAFPIAVRQTLDEAAFRMKKVEIEKSAKRFRKRHPGNIYRSFTRVNKAQGFNVNKMQAQAGWIDFPNSDFSENQQFQEKGGQIDNRSFVPLDDARTGSGQVKTIYRKSRLENLKILDAKKVTSRRGRGGTNVRLKSKKQRFVVAAIAAKQQFGMNAFVISQFRTNGSRIMYHITQARKTGTGLQLNYKPIYSVKGNRAVRTSATNYMTEAGLAAASRLDDYFAKNAKRQFDKVMR